MPGCTLGNDLRDTLLCLICQTHSSPFHAGPALQICYLHHAYGLGEHYNSLVPVVKEESEGAASVSGDE